MEPNSNNDVKDSSTKTVDNVQRDISSSDAKDFYPQSEPPGSTSLPASSLPTSPTSTPLVASPLQEQQLISASVTSASPTPTIPTSSSSITNNSVTTTTTTTNTAHKTQAAFVNKLYTMVEDQSIQHLISWAISGDVFSVSNPTEFSKTVLPQYFKHNNWQSFVRQLNINDMFHANPTSESQAWEFKHPEFRRGQLAALQNIKRKSSKHQTSNNIKGNLSSAGTGQNPSSDINAADAARDEKIEHLTNQMADIMDKMRQMSENYSLLYAETVSCRMQQSKHEKVITDIANFLSSILREEESNDPRNLKRKFDVDCIQAEVAKFGQGDIPPSPHPPMMQFPHYYREGVHPTRSMSTPQPMVGVESASSSHHSSSFLGSQSLHRSSNKIPSSSPLSMLPELPFTHHFQPSNNYLRHRSPEPITNASPSGDSRSSSVDASYRSSSMQSTSSNSSQTTPKYPQPNRSSTHPSHMQSASTPSRRASQPTTSLSFGSDSNLLNPSEINRYKDNNTTTIPKSQCATSSSPTSYNKSEDPIVTNPTTQQRPPPLPDPPDNEIDHNKRRKKN
ncbi:HSF-type DNA-binding-domain-containing protein [Gigaspora rosea]|uniref:HSF-type DNA-binding-domain-containing protein n=1 Tax=Gigaspora rosea TaxID=44941 RepID=A0A397UKY4_9GLOM|nr:HSF-type DNA-binding-domain-containing protein [Gigaspora rosea]